MDLLFTLRIARLNPPHVFYRFGFLGLSYLGVNMEDEEIVKMFNLILKRRETILFFLIVVINGLI